MDEYLRLDENGKGEGEEALRLVQRNEQFVREHQEIRRLAEKATEEKAPDFNAGGEKALSESGTKPKKNMSQEKRKKMKRSVCWKKSC